MMIFRYYIFSFRFDGTIDEFIVIGICFNQFEAKIFEYNSITPSIYVEDIKTLNGTIKILEDF